MFTQLIHSLIYCLLGTNICCAYFSYVGFMNTPYHCHSVSTHSDFSCSSLPLLLIILYTAYTSAVFQVEEEH
ncbi:hypothetical protein BDB01DRAFT_796971 [Pilobolus umbonatus]|nr:hypothetical protein BDB01DRAFT_796971 [Pilobolus umbonatus]